MTDEQPTISIVDLELDEGSEHVIARFSVALNFEGYMTMTLRRWRLLRTRAGPMVFPPGRLAGDVFLPDVTLPDRVLRRIAGVAKGAVSSKRTPRTRPSDDDLDGLHDLAERLGSRTFGRGLGLRRRADELARGTDGDDVTRRESTHEFSDTEEREA